MENPWTNERTAAPSRVSAPEGAIDGPVSCQPQMRLPLSNGNRNRSDVRSVAGSGNDFRTFFLSEKIVSVHGPKSLE